jgi:GAF domain-containing protein
VVRDARTDERLSGNPAIDEYQAIAYAGFPLRDPEGHVLGSFCAFDGEPRAWTERDVAVLRDLAQEAEAEIALRLSQGQLLLAAARTLAILDTCPDAFISMDHAGRVTAWKGTGLGLAVTHAIITAHHGAITARPRPGGGTEFVVALPVRATGA